MDGPQVGTKKPRSEEMEDAGYAHAGYEQCLSCHSTKASNMARGGEDSYRNDGIRKPITLAYEVDPSDTSINSTGTSRSIPPTGFFTSFPGTPKEDGTH